MLVFKTFGRCWKFWCFLCISHGLLSLFSEKYSWDFTICCQGQGNLSAAEYWFHRCLAKLAFWCILQLLIEKSIVRNFIVHPTQILLPDVSDTGDTTSGLQERGCSWVIQRSQNSQKDCSPWRLMKIVSWYWDCHRWMNYDTLCIDNKWINFFDGLGSVTTPQRCQLASNFRHLHQETMT